MRQETVNRRNIDWVIVLLFFMLSLAGIFNIYSSAYNPDHASLFDLSQEYGKQAMWWGISLVLAGIILLLDGSFLREMAYPMYAFCASLLILVLLIGNEVNGAKAWFGIGSFGIQPSEFMKVAVSLALARYLSSPNMRMTDLNTRLISIALLAGPAALILLQPDTGTVIVFCGFIFMFYREGMSGNILMYGFLGFALSLVSLMLKDATVEFPVIGPGVPAKYSLIVIITLVLALSAFLVSRLVMKRNRRSLYWLIAILFIGSSGIIMGVDQAFHKVLGDHQKTRIDIFLGLKDDPNGKGYNIDRAMASIGSGGLTGKGYMKATLATKQQKHVPMQSTDFIYCTLSEEWGFIGSFAVVVAFVFLLIRIIMIAERQRSSFTRIYAYCVACIFFMHFLVNVGMATGLVPVIGIPLPFFSYGGSSLMAFTILLAILVRLDAERMEVLR